MTRVQMTQAVSADYADAMMVARRAKNLLFLFLALVLLVQLGVFFTVRYVPGANIRGMIPQPVTTFVTPANGPTASAPVSPPTTQADDASATPTTNPTTAPSVADTLHGTTGGSVVLRPVQPAFAISYIPFDYLIAATDFLGVVLSIALAVVLLLIILVVLVGKPRNVVGIAPLTGAFCWSVLLIVFLFPWQALLNSGASASVAPATNAGHVAFATDVPDMKIPGVLYTYAELVRDYDFPASPLQYAILKWSRFVAFPVLSLIILLLVQGGSSRGLRAAVGEAGVVVDVPGK